MKRFLIYSVLILVVLAMLYVFMPHGILMFDDITPQLYLESKPTITIFNRWIIIVPSSTIIVYLLGIQILVLGYLLLRQHKTLWGISFLFWGVGTLLAGTSYQGFGYELKCSGQPVCEFTSWFELAYLFVTAISIAVMALAFAEDFTKGPLKSYLKRYAKGLLVVYTILLLMGSIFEIYFLISYELFTIFFMPLFVFFFVLNIRQFRVQKDERNKRFIILWILFLIVNVLYYAYYLPGFTETLYTNTGIWFSANDVLHVGLIGWFLYIQFRLAPYLGEYHLD
ncbi:hypothetical protein [Candidatus Xianfuyuplasma coldseepsis]|uniref:Uncharacterized protein n=1 Tax=Candidatus Xianfuyuplasma coldseepsis TaxID=2782163 RepID=A0A7L7KRD6_9MOLU|nr:hypothetical protein [Xianfuyuplasma coldseepsis]QMS85145.1 hypothetical protein G4Z02_05095 [Xianfuyuplasma coldseepsis]